MDITSNGWFYEQSEQVMNIMSNAWFYEYNQNNSKLVSSEHVHTLSWPYSNLKGNALFVARTMANVTHVPHAYQSKNVYSIFFKCFIFCALNKLKNSWKYYLHAFHQAADVIGTVLSYFPYCLHWQYLVFNC